MSEVLVLNKLWQPVKVINVWDAICKVYQDKASFLDANYVMHNWESWVISWKDAEIHAKDMIHGSSCSIRKPTVIVLKNYSGYVFKKPKMSRRNIYLRDANQCQYCGITYETKKLNIDHIIPKSHGGRTQWTNVVVSCIKCNSFKADRTPEQAGMKLLRKPKAPTWKDVNMEAFQRNYSNWHGLLNDMYWNVTLEK
ncbi:MAG: HNH endonuclease [Melioribacteraceae bacterium]|nr:HNH endonuclease [Melioribacteraceae bacterium]